jgi:hypothetical protein
LELDLKKDLKKKNPREAKERNRNRKSKVMPR